MYDYLSAMPHRPRFVRMHQILTCTGTAEAAILEGLLYGRTEDIVHFDAAGALTCDWTTVNRIYDILVGGGYKPIVELCNIPPGLARPGLTHLPRDWERWRRFVAAFTRHCLERYGLAELKTWCFELYNEVLNCWKEPPFDDLFRLYDYSIQGVLDVESALRVGGPTTTQCEHEYAVFRAFLDHCVNGINFATGKRRARLDFISAHAKGGNPPEGEHPDSDLIMRDLRRFAAIVREFPELKDVPFMNDEADPTWNGHLLVKDCPWVRFRNTHYFPVFICKMVDRYCCELEDELGLNVEVMCSDNGHVMWEPHTFAGGRSLVTPAGPFPTHDMIKKPVMNAFHMLGKLGDERLAVKMRPGEEPAGDAGVLATRKGRGCLSVLLYNMNDRLDAQGEKVFHLRFKKVPSELEGGRLIHYRIDSRHSNSYAEYERLSSPEIPTDQETRAIRRCENLRTFEPVEEISLEGGCLSKRVTMPMHSASLLVLVPSSADEPERPARLSAREETTYHGKARIVLQWNPDPKPDFLHFELERTTSLARPFKRLDEAGELTTGIYFDHEIAPGTKYYYRVRATNASGLAGEWSDIRSIASSPQG